MLSLLYYSHPRRLGFRQMKALTDSSPAPKWQPTLGPLCRGLVLLVATPCLPQRAMPLTCTLNASGDSLLCLQSRAPIPLHTLSLVSQRIDHIWATFAYLALCWKLEGVGQERRGMKVGLNVYPEGLTLL